VPYRFRSGTPRIVTPAFANFSLLASRILGAIYPLAIVYFLEARLEQSVQAVLRNSNVLNAVLNRGDLISSASSHDASRVWVLSTFLFPQKAGKHVDKG
jgi:hypothetical protein